MMPTWKQQDKTAASQLALLTTSNLSPVAVTDVSKISVYTANNAVLAMAKALIDTSIYKVEILDGSTLKSQTWTGRFKLTSYSDSDDTAEMKTAINIEINDDYIAYVNQQVDKAMGKVNDQGLQEIYKIDSLDTFKTALHKYSAQRLTSYQSAYQTAINVLTEQGVAANSSELHDSVYLPYYERFVALEAELSYRNSQLDTLTGLQKYIEDLIEKTHNELDFETYIGEQYWKLFTYYRREDDYSNENYISDGLTNTELINKASELLTVAKKELIKSGEKQFTISGTLQNLLLLTDKDGNRIFEPILDDFTLGNFIRTKIDEKIYVMRLADISISYGDLSKLSVTFSDAYKYGNSIINIIEDTLKKSQSMATSYSSTIKQASQGEKANLTFEKLQKEGLDSALYSVHNTNSTAIFDEHGILIRSYDDVLDDYKDEQARINVNEFVYTTDRWRTAVTALGKQKYTLDGVEYVIYGWHFSPKMDAMDLGTSSWKWGQIWAQTGEINTSDRNQKHNIQILDEDICVQITEKLKPSSYIMNDNTSGRTHYGFIAQDIEDMISELGIDSKEFAALIKSPKVKTVQDENGIEVCEEIPNEYVYSLRYTEFIPIAFRTLQYCIKEIKSLNKQIETLKDE